jgi:hypothetical protein
MPLRILWGPARPGAVILLFYIGPGFTAMEILSLRNGVIAVPVSSPHVSAVTDLAGLSALAL